MNITHHIAASLLFLPLAAHAQTTAVPQMPAQSPVVVNGAVQFDLPSRITGRTYRIFVRKPRSAPPATGFPMAIVTDGNAVFPIVAQTEMLGEMAGDKPAVIVGVGYPTDDEMSAMTLRNKDLTPTSPRPGPSDEKLGVPKPEDTGGAEAFYRFITEELRPLLMTTYPIDPKEQTLAGHSLGGLFALHTMFRHPDAFQTYAISSPSIWWDDRVVLKDEAAFTRAVAAGEVSPRVLILSGGQEESMPARLPPGISAETMRKNIETSRMVSNARALAGRLSAIKGRGDYAVSYHVFDGEGHMSVVPAAIGRSLNFALARR